MTSEKIKKKAIDLGFDSCGIIPANIFGQYAQALDERVKSFPASEKLYKALYKFANPPENGKSCIVCLRRTNKYAMPDAHAGLFGKHYLFDGRLKYSEEHRAEKEFETFLAANKINIIECDVPDRLAAAKAGLGKFGRNNFLYSMEYGSYVGIYCWVVDKELEYDEICEDIRLSQCEDGCEKCVKSCPTNSLSGAFSMDRGTCIAHLFWDAGDILSEELREQMSTWIYGCDVCQDVCPVNQDKRNENEPFPLLEQFEEYMKPQNLLEMDEETYKNIINPRFWYLGEEKLWLWKCNTLRSMINSKNPKYHDQIKAQKTHEDKRIREVAEWGCRKLGL